MSWVKQEREREQVDMFRKRTGVSNDVAREWLENCVWNLNKALTIYLHGGNRVGLERDLAPSQNNNIEDGNTDNNKNEDGNNNNNNNNKPPVKMAGMMFPSSTNAPVATRPIRKLVDIDENFDEEYIINSGDNNDDENEDKKNSNKVHTFSTLDKKENSVKERDLRPADFRARDVISTMNDNNKHLKREEIRKEEVWGCKLGKSEKEKEKEKLRKKKDDSSDDDDDNDDDDDAITVTITFWRTGFTLNEGNLRRTNILENRNFLMDINSGRIPDEIGKNCPPGKKVKLNLVDRKLEDYVKPNQIFQGEEHHLNSNINNNNDNEEDEDADVEKNVTINSEECLQIKFRSRKGRVDHLLVDENKCLTLFDLVGKLKSEKGVEVCGGLRTGMDRTKTYEHEEEELKNVFLKSLLMENERNIYLIEI